MSAMLLMQSTPWLPIWVTPLWVLGVGVAMGFLAVLAILVVLAVLSRVPGLGTLADRPAVANTVAAVLTAILSGVLLYLYLPHTSADYRGLLVLPMVALSGIVAWGVIYGMWRRTISELWSAMTEGVMTYILGTLGLVMLVGLAVTPMVDNPRENLASLRQLNWVGDGTVATTWTVPAMDADIADPDAAPFHQYMVQYDPQGVQSLTIETDRTIILADAERPEDFAVPPRRLDPDTRIEWRRGDLDAPPLSGNPDDGVWIQNREIDPATVTIRITSAPPVPEMSTAAITALCVVLLVLGYLALRQAAPRVAAIAMATAKSEMAQPLYIVLLALGIVVLILFMVLPFHTLGEDIKMMKDSGMTLIMVLGLILAVWSAGTSVSEEIEGRTALTVLSKPVSRRSFLLGKYTGIMLSVLVLFLILGALLLVVTAYKPIFEARENSMDEPLWQESHREMISVVPGLVLYYMETMAIGAIGVALATRLAMLANFLICFTIYVIGNLTSPLVQSSAGENELVGFVGKLIAVVVPNLNTFNVQSAMDVGNAIPPIYLAGAFNYLVCFGVLALMVALLLFEDRDLA